MASMTSEATQLTVHDPRGYPPKVTGKALAPRLDRLDGKRPVRWLTLSSLAVALPETEAQVAGVLSGWWVSKILLSTSRQAPSFFSISTKCVASVGEFELVGKVIGQRRSARSRHSHIKTKLSGRKASSKVASGWPGWRRDFTSRRRLN